MYIAQSVVAVVPPVAHTPPGTASGLSSSDMCRMFAERQQQINQERLLPFPECFRVSMEFIAAKRGMGAWAEDADR